MKISCQENIENPKSILYIFQQIFTEVFKVKLVYSMLFCITIILLYLFVYIFFYYLFLYIFFFKYFKAFKEFLSIFNRSLIFHKISLKSNSLCLSIFHHPFQLALMSSLSIPLRLPSSDPPAYATASWTV